MKGIYIKCSILALTMLLNSSTTYAKLDYSSLSDAFSQCDASQFNVKIDWGNNFQPKFNSLPNCIQVKPLKEFRLRRSYTLMPAHFKLFEAKEGYLRTNYYQFADDAFRDSFITTELLTGAAFSLPNESVLGDRYGANPAYQICQYIWYKLDSLSGQAGTSFDPSGKTHNFMITMPATCYWGHEGVAFRENPVTPSLKMRNYSASPFWIVQFDKGTSKEREEEKAAYKGRHTNHYRNISSSVSKGRKSYRHFPLWLRDIKWPNTDTTSKGVRILYHDDAQFIKILRPKGAKASDYPVLVYGGQTLNAIPFERVVPSTSPVTKNMDILGDKIKGVFISTFDKKEKRFVEAGTLLDFLPD